MPKTLSVRNLTRGTVLVSCGSVADNYWTRFKGLMGVRTLKDGYGLLLKNESAIHTFGMQLPIDVVYLDKEGKVLGITADMRPSRIGPLVRGAKNVLELPTGTLARTKTQLGDKLEFQAYDAVGKSAFESNPRVE